VGDKLTSPTATYFGYIFGATNSSSQNSSIPASLKTVIITGGSSIANNAFYGCTNLTSVIIPNSVTSIGSNAFSGCTSLTSVTFQGTITANNFNSTTPFPGDLRDTYLAYLAGGGGIGTYTRTSGGTEWTKK